MESRQRNNFRRLLLSQVLVKLGDAISSPKTVLAWLWVNLGAPEALLALLVPIRESGSMVPQIFSAGFIRTLAVRKWVWVIGAVVQSLSVVAIAGSAWFFRGATAGWAILVCVAIFSVARSLSSVASKDVVGKAIPKGMRGRLTGLSASIAGLISIGVGVMLTVPSVGGDARSLEVLLLLAAVLWALAAAVYARIHEPKGEAAKAGRVWRGTLSRLSLLRTDKPFRLFVVTRALMMCSALSAPYYVLLARRSAGNSAATLGFLVVAAGVAALVSGPIWGRFADRSSRRVMQVASLSTALLAALLFAMSLWAPTTLNTLWFVPACYFLLSIAHGGARIGRKTYVIDLAGGNKRTDYVATSNTVIGVLLLAAGAVGLLSSVLSSVQIIAVLGSMGLCAGLLARWLPEAGEELRPAAYRPNSHV